MALDVGKLRAELELDTSAYKRESAAAKSDFQDLGKTAEQSGRRVEKAFDGSSKGVEKIGTSAKSASGEVDRAQSSMSSAFGKVESDARASAGGVSKAFAQAGSESAGSFREKVSGMFEGVADRAGEAGGEGGGQFVAGFAPAIASLGTKGGAIGMALAAAGVVAFGAGAVLAGQVRAGFETQQRKGELKAEFGWTPEQLKTAGAAASKAYVGGFGESTDELMRSAGVAMQSGMLDGNATAAQIQPVIERLTTVSKIMGTDIPETSRAAGQMVKTGMAKNAVEAMDLLTSAQQKGLNTSGDLLDTMNEYSTQFRKVGLDGADALGLVQQAMQGGARDSDIAADAVKEFAIRAVDGSKSTTEAYQALGLNADDMAARFAKGGPVAKAALDQILDSLRSTTDDTKRGQIAAALFGTQWEDLGGAFGKFDLSNARQQMGSFGGAAKKAADDMTTPLTSIQSLKREVEVTLSGMQEQLAAAFGPSVTDFASDIRAHKDEIIAFFSDVVSAALTMGIGMGNVAAGLLHLWGSTTGELGKLVGGVVQTIGKATSALGGLLEHIPGMGKVGNAMKSAGDLAQGTGKALSEMGDASHATANFIADRLVPALAGARDGIDSTGAAAHRSAEGMAVLRDSVISIPDEQTVIIRDNSPEAKKKLEDLGFVVREMPDGTVKVFARTDEAREKIDQLKKPEEKWINIRTRVQQSDYASRVIDELIRLNPQGSDSDANKLVAPNAFGSVRQFDGPLPRDAVIQNAQFGKRGLVQWAETDAGPWEAYIPGGIDKRSRAVAILGEVARRFGLITMAPGELLGGALSILQRGDYQGAWSKYGIDEDSPVVDFLMKRRAGQKDSPLDSARKDVAAVIDGARGLAAGNYNGTLADRFNIEEDNPLVGAALALRERVLRPAMKMASGGVVALGNISGEGITTNIQQSMWDAVRTQFPQAVLSSATRSVQTEGHADYHNVGKAIDLGGPISALGAQADWIVQTFSNILELIHNPFGHNMKDGRDVGDGFGFYGAGTMGAHGDHVHWAMGSPVSPGGLPSGVQDITLTPQSTRDDVARKIIAEGRRRGYSDEQITVFLSHGIGESNLAMQNNPAGWNGYFQQDSSYPGRDDPNTNVTGFYDRMDEKRRSPGWSQDTWKDVFWLQQRPGDQSADAAFANGRQAYMAEMRAHESEARQMMATLGPTVGSSSSAAGGGLSDPSGLSSTSDTAATSSSSTPPEDPSTVTLQFSNPLQPFWWAGEKKYRDHIIDEYEKQKAWDEYWTKQAGGVSKSKDTPASASSLAGAESAVAESKRSLAEATEAQRVAEMKLDEVKGDPKATPSAIAAAEQRVIIAKNNVTLATERQQAAELKLKELQASGSGLSTADVPGVGPAGAKGEKAAPPSSIAKAESNLAEAQRTLTEKQAAERIAAMKLDEKKGDPKATPSAIATAQAAVTRAHNDVTQAQERVNTTQLQLDELRRKGHTIGLKMGGGGTIPGHGDTDSVPLLGMPGEEIIRKHIAEQPGMRAYLKAINSGVIKPQRFGDGGTVGFGGYSDDNRDSMAPKNWYDWTALGVGAGFAAYNMIEPYAGILTSGKVDLGNITPRLNTATTDTQMISSTMSAVAGQVTEQLDKIFWAIKEGKDITVKIEGGQAPSFNEPQLAAGVRGLF